MELDCMRRKQSQSLSFIACSSKYAESSGHMETITVWWWKDIILIDGM